MNGWKFPFPSGWEESVWNSYLEDLGNGDLSANCVDPGQTSSWYIEAQATGVACGVGIAHWLMRPDDEECEVGVQALVDDGDRVERGTRVLEGRWHTSSLVARERTALNFLMLLSGTATLTAKFVEAVSGTQATIVDTRKTIPGFRTLQKYAVRCGGGTNHRRGLYDGVMLKDNHLQAIGSIKEGIRRAKANSPHTVKIEVECETIEQVQMAVENGADIVMLDNMDPFTMREAVKRFEGQCTFEASGGVTLDTVHQVASTGVTLISVGALTHSAPALPFHLEFERDPIQ